MMSKPNRKDTAASYTRKIVLDTTPLRGISTAFQKVEQMVITDRCFVKTTTVGNQETNMQFLKLCICLLGNKPVNSTPLHLVLHLTGKVHSQFEYLLSDILTLVPLTFECLDMRIGMDTISDLKIGYMVGAVVKFSCGGLLDPAKIVLDLVLLFDCWLMLGIQPDKPCRIYLRNIPQLVFSSEELADITEAGTANNAAKRKLCKIVASGKETMFIRTLERWEEFLARVHFVKSGFRPSPAAISSTLRLRWVLYSSFLNGH